jgi:hypothetical protein
MLCLWRQCGGVAEEMRNCGRERSRTGPTKARSGRELEQPWTRSLDMRDAGVTELWGRGPENPSAGDFRHWGGLRRSARTAERLLEWRGARVLNMLSACAAKRAQESTESWTGRVPDLAAQHWDD